MPYTIFWTEFSGGIELLLKRFYFCAWILLFACFGASGQQVQSLRQLLLREVSEPCLKTLKSAQELQYLDLSSSPAALEKGLASFSSDLLVKLVLFLEQDIGGRCALSRRTLSVVDDLKTAYLAKLNISRPEEPGALDTLFRGFVLSKNEFGALSVKPKSTPKNLSPLQRIGLGYDSYAERQGRIVIIAPRAELAAQFQSSISALCEGRTRCPFWDDKVIERVMIVEQPGVASFLPELGVLVLSKSLWDEPRLLHQIVLLHELTHAAERGAFIERGESWRAEFQAFSGLSQDRDGNWHARAHPIHARWNDALTQMADSFFDLKPDEVVVGEPGFDGFAMEKTLRETLKRGDVSEDIADHVALFRYLPQRFCWRGKPLAPKKYDWIARKAFFANPPKPVCQ